MTRIEAVQRLVTLSYKAELENGVVMVELASDKEYKGLRNQIEKMEFHGSWGCRYPRTEELCEEKPAEKSEEQEPVLSVLVEEPEEDAKAIKEGQLTLDDLFSF